ncbi:phosphonate metabolism protein PhnP [Oceanimonas baumannii]|uniref:Phosphonate metabolism protein PhnP n=1 Tax=Oceanimonas baumannii TaxID=129578 RepID=A0A235CHE3_9GAMM|nr:phosphonate metabolism protein PhnP [Oceanimonas baumannii]OYD23265.1 phosphonate metabolism protein PhnP [Oceanimonas baumannii]TDW58592.1 phosphoribosyl 1,2-cyclic phosphate phosphodiesterase [Oceanimonas baumannii]
MRLTLLGTGAAGGIPLYGCDCTDCRQARAEPPFGRAPCSALLEWGEHRLLLDAGLMDLHRRFAPGTLSGILLTHFHVDHVQGLFHLRWGPAAPIPVWCPNDPNGCADLLKHPGCLAFRPEMAHGRGFQLDGLQITPLDLVHSRPTLGYLFEYDGRRLAYLTDTIGLPPHSLALLQALPPLDVLVLDCSFGPGVEGRNHNGLDQVMALCAQLKPARTVLTHIGHDFHRWLRVCSLPPGVEAGRDNMVIIPGEPDH